MGILTIVLDDRVERRLRERVALLHGSRKGALSGSIQEAVESWLRGSSSRKDEGRRFRAYGGGQILMEAGSLRELVVKLREAEIDPRGVEIKSSEPLEEVVRMGVRLRRR